MAKTGLYIQGILIGLRRVQPIGGAKSKDTKHRIMFACEKCRELMKEFTDISVKDGVVLIDCEKCEVRGYAFLNTEPANPFVARGAPACVLHVVHSKQIYPALYRFASGWEAWSHKEIYRKIKVENEKWSKREAGVELRIQNLRYWFASVP